MIAEELEHHVVHYGKECSGLYLIALINNETGEELDDVARTSWADRNRVPYIPTNTLLSVDRALTDNEKNAEGYVLAWPRPGRTPLRVKVKFVDFLRLQKLVHHIGPKEILDYMPSRIYNAIWTRFSILRLRIRTLSNTSKHGCFIRG